VVGDFLYIDGGEIFQPTGSNVPKAYPLNSTYSISLKSTWTNSSIALNQIAKGAAPVLNDVNLFPDAAGTSFFAYNGLVSTAYSSANPTPPQDQLWQFLPNGDGGKWTIAESPNLDRVAYVGAAQGNGTAYFLGGWENWRTTTAYHNNTGLRYPAGGLVSYDLNTRTWANQSIAELAPTGWSFNSQVHYLKGLPKTGLLLAMGGATAAPGFLASGEEILNSYGYVSLYDTDSSTWYNQTTTGDIPVQRYGTCSVGLTGDNGTFEVSYTTHCPSSP
jgi:hypothetical protein